MGFFIMSDISTTELLNSSNESLQKKMHVALPAKVVSFNASEQTVTIELMITQMAHDDSMLDLPPLVDCLVCKCCIIIFLHKLYHHHHVEFLEQVLQIVFQ